MSIRRLYYTADLVNKISIAYIFIEYTCNYDRVYMCVCVLLRPRVQFMSLLYYLT